MLGFIFLGLFATWLFIRAAKDVLENGPESGLSVTIFCIGCVFVILVITIISGM